jgi:thymidylate kinase
MNIDGKAMTVAFCGLDGVGKTTLFNMLSDRIKSREYAFITKGQVDAERLIEKRIPRNNHDYRDWLDGLFSEAIAVACAIDYCVYYDKVIEPAIYNTEKRVVITDRHAICFLAYANINKKPNQIAVSLLESIQPPDVIIYIKAPEGIIMERAKTSDKPFDEFEDYRSQREQALSYLRLLPEYDSHLIEVDNSGGIESTYETVLGHINRCLDEFEKHGRLD